MAMTKEKLLIPRYMCTGTPGKPLWYLSRFNHGDVIEMDGKGFYEMKDRSGGIHLFKNEYFTDFPHLFRPMHWWESRKPEDMPEYVRSLETNRVYKRYEQSSYYGFEPASETEYLDYINQKEG